MTEIFWKLKILKKEYCKNLFASGEIKAYEEYVNNCIFLVLTFWATPKLIMRNFVKQQCIS